jgi:hypothetical protein
MMTKTQEQGDAPQRSNLDRLQERLKKDDLAGKLVAARIAAGNADPQPSLRTVIRDRVEELKRKYEPVPDKQA